MTNDMQGKLARLRERIQQKKESDNKLQGIFEKKKEEIPAKNRKITKISKGIRELEKDKRITTAAAAYLDIVPKGLAEVVEQSYPQTLQAIYRIAKTLVEGKWGPQLQAAAKAQSEELFNWEALSAFLVFDCSKEKTSEIFQGIEKEVFGEAVTEIRQNIEPKSFGVMVYPQFQNGIVLPENHLEMMGAIGVATKKIELSLLKKRVLLRTYKKYLENVSNPSSVGIKILLKQTSPVEDSVEAAMKIKNRTERSKSIVTIVQRLLTDNRVDRAMKVIESVKTNVDQTGPMTELINGLFDEHRKNLEELMQNKQLDQALAMVDTMEDLGEKEALLKKVVAGLASHGKISQALEIAGKIQDSDERNFSLSTVVNILVQHENFTQAQEVAGSIQDPDFRQDAEGYILKGILEKCPFSEVLTFLQSISNVTDRARAVKFISSYLRAQNEEAKVEEIRTLFPIQK